MFKKSYLTYGIIILLMIGGFILIGWPRQPKDRNQSQVRSSVAGETTYDFGQIKINGGNVSHVYEIKNKTDKPMTVKKMYTSCMCTTATLIRGEKRVGPFGMPGHGLSEAKIEETLAPGETAKVEVVFDPAAHGPAGLGKVERVVTLETSDNQRMELQFKAEVTP